MVGLQHFGNWTSIVSLRRRKEQTFVASFRVIYGLVRDRERGMTRPTSAMLGPASAPLYLF